jgi:diguanylate cyclase (GGDEF)-like protein
VKKITLLQKLVISYAAIALFTLIALVVSYAGLYSLNSTARGIVTRDFVLISAVNKLRESLLAQQNYAAKYAILRESEFRDMFLKREAEFQETLLGIRMKVPDQSLDELDSVYREFDKIAHQVIDGAVVKESGLLTAAGKVNSVIDKSLSSRQQLLREKLESARQKEQLTVRWTLIISLTGFMFALGFAALLIFNISNAVHKLKRAAHRISEGDFDYDPNIPPGDEVGDLAEDFTRMAARLKELEQMSLDASPLTRLPGNIAIESVLERRLNEGSPFAVCYADLDNFKAYNDRYGYIQASELIKKTGEVIHETVTTLTGSDSFIGHVGGDDFIMVINPEEVEPVCSAVIERFDHLIPEFYAPGDLVCGAIEGPDRYGVHRRFPIMTISISVVICRKGTFDSAISIARAAAEMKDNLKGQPGSNYAINKRISPR